VKPFSPPQEPSGLEILVAVALLDDELVTDVLEAEVLEAAKLVDEAMELLLLPQFPKIDWHPAPQ
jgi:hypothetical protein